jgi:hypothetical protein
MRTLGEVSEFVQGSDELRGYVRLDLVPVTGLAALSPHEAADSLVERLGFNPIGRLAWRVLSTSEAVELLKAMLHHAMAYHQELLPSKTAEHLARTLVSALSTYSSKFVANGDIAEGRGAGWTPIGTATFEMAFVGFDDVNAFLLYAEDED